MPELDFEMASFLWMAVILPFGGFCWVLVKWFFAVNTDRKELKRQVTELQKLNRDMAADFKVVNTLINDLSKEFNSRITELLQSFYQREKND